MVNYGKQCPAPGRQEVNSGQSRRFSASPSPAAYPISPNYGPAPCRCVPSGGPATAIWRQYSYSAIVVAVATL